MDSTEQEITQDNAQAVCDAAQEAELYWRMYLATADKADAHLLRGAMEKLFTARRNATGER